MASDGSRDRPSPVTRWRTRGGTVGSTGRMEGPSRTGFPGITERVYLSLLVTVHAAPLTGPIAPSSGERGAGDWLRQE